MSPVYEMAARRAHRLQAVIDEVHVVVRVLEPEVERH